MLRVMTAENAVTGSKNVLVVDKNEQPYILNTIREQFLPPEIYLNKLFFFILHEDLSATLKSDNNIS